MIKLINIGKKNAHEPKSASREHGAPGSGEMASWAPLTLRNDYAKAVAGITYDKANNIEGWQFMVQGCLDSTNPPQPRYLVNGPKRRRGGGRGGGGGSKEEMEEEEERRRVGARLPTV